MGTRAARQNCCRTGPAQEHTIDHERMRERRGKDPRPFEGHWGYDFAPASRRRSSQTPCPPTESTRLRQEEGARAGSTTLPTKSLASSKIPEIDYCNTIPHQPTPPWLPRATAPWAQCRRRTWWRGAASPRALLSPASAAAAAAAGIDSRPAMRTCACMRLCE